MNRLESAHAYGNSQPGRGKEMTQKAAGLLTGSCLLQRHSKASVAWALEAMVKGVNISLKQARSMSVVIVFTPRGKIVVGGLGRSPRGN